MARLLSVAKIITADPVKRRQLLDIKRQDERADRQAWRAKMQATWKANELVGGMRKTRYGTWED